jgi:hypothetical protein
MRFRKLYNAETNNMMISHAYINIDRNSHGFGGETKRDTYFFPLLEGEKCVE